MTDFNIASVSVKVIQLRKMKKKKNYQVVDVIIYHIYL